MNPQSKLTLATRLRDHVVQLVFAIQFELKQLLSYGDFNHRLVAHGQLCSNDPSRRIKLLTAFAMKGLDRLRRIARRGIDILGVSVIDIVETKPHRTNCSRLHCAVTNARLEIPGMNHISHDCRKVSD